MDQAFRHIRFTYKQAIIVGFMSLGVIIALATVLASYRSMVLDGRMMNARTGVEIAYRILEDAHDQIAANGLSEQEAQAVAIREIRHLRYGDGDYFWINDLHPRMVMHPYMPELEGRDLTNYQDAEGRYLFRQMVEAVRTTGEGVVQYHWRKPGQSGEALHKVSYVKKFSPWGWIIGSGVYIDDIDAAWRQTVGKAGGFMLFIMTVTIGLVFAVVRGTARPIETLAAQVTSLADGKDVDIGGTDRRDEIGSIARALHSFQEKLRLARVQERRIRLHEKKAEKSVFVLRIKEKALARRIKEKEILERELQQSIAEADAARAAAVRAKDTAEHEGRTIAILRRVAQTANEAADVNMAMRSILSLICGFIDWPLGHVFTVDEASNCLQSTGIWHVRDARKYDGFMRLTSETVFGLGMGLPGGAWQKRAPLWIDDVEKGGGFLRLGGMMESGIKSGFAFPVIADEKVIFVFEFFNDRPVRFGDEVLAILYEIGGQLARVVERDRAAEALRQAKQAAEKANVAKSDFLANMSHELRTPLNSILGMLRFLQESALPEKQKYMAATAFRSSVSLLETVNDILDLSKIESGEMKFEQIGFDPFYTVESVMQVLEQPAAEKHLKLVRGYAGMAMPYVVGDPTRVGRVLTNLVGNAIKYTEQGTVEVRLACDPVDERHVVFRCEVIDTGIGIPENKLGAIFEKFVQADTSTTRKYGGSGLGLCITKQLVEGMGGSIGVRSIVGVGSTFFFSIPFEVTDKLHEEKNIRRQKMLCGYIPAEKARILIAEDHVLNQVLMREIMERFGVGHYHIAANGNEVIAAWKDSAWDIILMDCHMPDKNGYDATIDIRRMEQETETHVPIIAMTANAMIGDREKCLRCGMDGYVSKPIDIDELHETLGQWIRFGDRPVSAAAVQVASDDETDSVLDTAQLRSITMGDGDMEREVFALFIKHTAANIEELRERVDAEGDDRQWTDTAHMIKGAAANVGAARLARVAAEAQLYVGGAAGRRDLLARLEAAYDELQSCLRASALYP